MFLAAFTASQTKYIPYLFAKIRAKNPRNVTLSPFLKRIPAYVLQKFSYREPIQTLLQIFKIWETKIMIMKPAGCVDQSNQLYFFNFFHD